MPILCGSARPDEQPFERTAAWMDMRWRGGCYLPVREPPPAEAALLDPAERIAA